MILTAEQQSAIETARSDMLDLRAQLREVRYALNKDVDDLKAWLTVVNIWAMPLAVGLLAVLVALWRARRARLGRGGPA